MGLSQPVFHCLKILVKPCATHSSLVLRQKSSGVNSIYLKFFLIKKSIFNKKNTLYKHKGI